jgi:NlpC/P60 family putative phage cell wall peptidase
MEVSRAAILREARSWIGTPYHHQASLKGVGCNCLGLVRGVWRAVLGPEPEAIPGYSSDWGEVGADETMLAAARRHLIEIDPAEAGAGDVMVFRMRPGRVAKHAGILTKGEWRMANGAVASPRSILAAQFIHAQEGGPVCEVALGPWWRSRLAGVFAFPGVFPATPG